MKTGYAILAVIAAAGLMTFVWAQDPQPFEQDVARAALTNEARKPESGCPLSDEVLTRTETWKIAGCLAGGLSWYGAMQRYDGDAARVFAVYGEEPAFLEVFDRHGHPVIPVITYFIEHGSRQYQIEDGLSRLLRDRQWSFRDLSPEQYGLIAIHELSERGHEMLSEFEIVDGKAKRKPITRTLLAGKNLLLGGMSDLESVIVRGERLPTLHDVGWAALDLAVIGGGTGAAVKILRAGTVRSKLAGQTAGRMTRLKSTLKSAFGSLSAVGKGAGVAAIIAVPYVALSRPDLIIAAAGWLSEAAGLPAWVGVFLAYAATGLALVVLVRIALRPLAWFVYVLYLSLGRLSKTASLDLKPHTSPHSD